ncbi:MAG: hypothetical protein ACREOO_05305 [bacterium]
MDDAKYKKLLDTEVGMIKKRIFVRGILVGVLSTVLLLGAAGGYFWANRMQYAASAAEYVAGDFLWSVFRYFPDGYVSNNREKFINTLDAFTNAVSFGKITQSDFQRLSATFMASLQDRKLTYQEIDDILRLMNEAADGGYTQPVP